jgi:pimeloyl-ACP methyl ester carboxylesterase
MPFIERNGRTVHYTVQGDGPGVVLVPGLGSGARLFGTLPRRFARHGFTCAAVDPVGLSPSSPLGPSGYDFDEAARDVLAVAAALPGPTSLVGTSLQLRCQFGPQPARLPHVRTAGHSGRPRAVR